MAAKRELLNGIVNRIALVGVEMEGGWTTAFPDTEIVHDGSVKFKSGQPRLSVDANGNPIVVTVPGPRITGEVVSPAIAPTAVEEWMTKYYPPFVNETCGLHVHMSFYHKLNYSRLMTPDYMHTVIAALHEFGTEEGIPPDHMLWNRLNPDHKWTKEHCSHVYLGDAQAVIRGKDYRSRGTKYSRYTAINYCEAQHRKEGSGTTGTVECRLLPMFEKPEQGYRAVMKVINTTNRFLSKVRVREKRIEAVVMQTPVAIQEFGTFVR